MAPATRPKGSKAIKRNVPLKAQHPISKQAAPKGRPQKPKFTPIPPVTEEESGSDEDQGEESEVGENEEEENAARGPPPPPKRQKKGKKFASLDSMMNLIDTISTKQETSISKKVERHQANASRDLVTKKNKIDRKNGRRSELETVKKQLRNGTLKIQKRKENKKAKAKLTSQDDSKKKVRFNFS